MQASDALALMHPKYFISVHLTMLSHTIVTKSTEHKQRSVDAFPCHELARSIDEQVEAYKRPCIQAGFVEVQRR